MHIAASYDAGRATGLQAVHRVQLSAPPVHPAPACTVLACVYVRCFALDVGTLSNPAQALFSPVCLQRDADGETCLDYSAWSYNWQTDGVWGAVSYLQ
jgi:hypothetical protein